VTYDNCRIDCDSSNGSGRRRRLSTTAVIDKTMATDDSVAVSSKNDDTNSKKSNPTSGGGSSSSTSSNIFLDNLGTMFLLFIGSIIAWLVRSYYNGVRRNTVRTTFIESTAHADPIELDELRIANSELTPSVFHEIIQHIILDQTTTTTATTTPMEMTYPEFIYLVRTAMMKIHGEAFTIQCGHIIDRVVLAALIKYENRNNRTSNNNNNNNNNKSDQQSDPISVKTNMDDIDPATNLDNTNHPTSLIDQVKMPIEFWLTVLSLALHSSAKERIGILHSIFHQFSSVVLPSSESAIENVPADKTMISMNQVIQLIGYLQDTCQLVPDAQIIMTTHKYPLQEYIVGTPEQMIDHQQWDMNTDGNSTTTIDTAKFKGNNITVDMLSDILSSRSVCAWGECYKYKSK
jgi:hypothetical protein